MRPWRFAALAAAVALAFPAGGAQAANAGSPIAPAASAGGTPEVLALAGGVVWLYDGSSVLRSTDNGASWRRVFPNWAETPTSLQVEGAYFLGKDDAWAVTDREWPAQPGSTTVWRTTDGGLHWQEGVSLPGPLSYGVPTFDQFSFANAKDGFGFGTTSSAAGTEETFQSVLWATSDGGLRWQQVSAVGLPGQGAVQPINPVATNNCGPGPFSLEAASAEVLFLFDSGCPSRRPGFWRSADGGKDWRPVAVPAPPGGWLSQEAWEYPPRSATRAGAEVGTVLAFNDASAVMAVSTRPGELLVYRSSDVGASWSLASVLGTGSLARPSGFSASSPAVWELPAPAGLYVTADAGEHWSLRRSAVSLPPMSVASFASPEVGIGWAATYGVEAPGYLPGWRTTNGGATWSPVGPLDASRQSLPPLSTVDFVSPMDGWVAGGEGVLRTTDGGRTWASHFSPRVPLEQLSFADAEHGWALGPDELFATSDGGASWQALPEPRFGELTWAQRVSANFGVAEVCAEEGGTRVLATYDGGLSWHVLPVPDVNQLDCANQLVFNEPPVGLCFGTPQVGWAAISLAGGKGALEHTVDGGRKWEVVATFDPFPSGVACYGPTQAWVTLTWQLEHGAASTLAVTTDGAKTWSFAAYPAEKPFFSPTMSAADGAVLGKLGAAGVPGQVWHQPIAALADPGPGDADALWEEGVGACAFELGIISTEDGGSRWSSSPVQAGAATCQTSVGLPYIESSLPPHVLSVSFPSALDGFVLGTARGAPAGSQTAPVDLIGTNDGGRRWALLARLP